MTSRDVSDSFGKSSGHSLMIDWLKKFYWTTFIMSFAGIVTVPSFYIYGFDMRASYTELRETYIAAARLAFVGSFYYPIATLLILYFRASFNGWPKLPNIIGSAAIGFIFAAWLHTNTGSAFSPTVFFLMIAAPLFVTIIWWIDTTKLFSSKKK